MVRDFKGRFMKGHVPHSKGKTKIPKREVEYKKCECGCGTIIPKYQGREGQYKERKYSLGHNGRKIPIEIKNKIIPCACGCGTMINRFTKGGVERRWVKGHNLIGVPKTEKQKESIRKSLTGRKQSLTTIEKRANSNRDKKYPEELYPNKGMRNKNHKKETIEKIRKGNIGKIVPLDIKNKIRKKLKQLWKNKGYRNKMLKVNKGKHYSEKTEFKKGIIPWNKGKKLSKEEYPNYGIRRFRDKLILPFKDSTIEVKLQEYLKQLGIEFATHVYMKEIEHKYRCDIFIPSMNLVIEADGDYWHYNKKICKKEPSENQLKQKERDEARTKELLEKGYNVIRIWENKIRKMSLEDFKEVLKNGY